MTASVNKSLARALVVGLAGCLLAAPALADTLRLANGDSVTGKVLSIDAEQVQLESDVLGKLTIPRAKIASIHFGDAPPAAAPAQAAPADLKVPKLPAITAEQKKYLEEQTRKTGATPADVLKQLQSGGVDPNAVDEITRNLPGFAAPEVQEYFNNTLGGLQSGQLNIGDIRKDAVKARDQIKELQEELGPEAAALNGYLGILENFIRKTESEAEPQPKAAPQSSSPKSSAPKSKTPPKTAGPK
ncbi:hypothetical protein [Lignipirellula cremea]|uniref:Uncharacterized protein n=1 Tax=Lignipirellula cremea TaxID=2528010 RepID=A0A518DZT1_9BACT|nr:hypothetical protein [Lignipirellula cremea]QDU97321.1 hypothetical protein Pla8534_51670 [Lignipirellula cremea]